jgi:S1-C subfamily serine protease
MFGPACTQVQVAPGVSGEYKVGELQVFADADFATVYEAAKKGLKDQGLFETRDDRKVVEAELNGRDATDTLVVVKIKEVGAKRTSVKIRYGVLKPDLSAAQSLYQKILKRM